MRLSLPVALFLLSQGAAAQSIVDQIGAGGGSLPAAAATTTETVLRISRSQSIFILSNRDSGLAKGDFVSLVLQGRLTARALVTMTAGERAGIKIHRIHSLTQWGKLREGTEVQVLRGDERPFLARTEEGEPSPSISPETPEDLFDETLLEDDMDIEEDGSGVIVNNNVLAFSMDSLEVTALAGTTTRHFQPNVSWAYQFEENLWFELVYGRGIIKAFPADDINTALDNVVLRIQYAISAPLYTIVQPYVGYQRTMADSPNAGQSDQDNSISPARLLDELDDVESLEKSRVVFGVSLLRRLVPSWFIKGTVGSDALSLGLALEF